MTNRSPTILHRRPPQQPQHSPRRLCRLLRDAVPGGIGVFEGLIDGLDFGEDFGRGYRRTMGEGGCFVERKEGEGEWEWEGKGEGRLTSAFARLDVSGTDG